MCIRGIQCVTHCLCGGFEGEKIIPGYEALSTLGLCARGGGRLT